MESREEEERKASAQSEVEEEEEEEEEERKASAQSEEEEEEEEEERKASAQSEEEEEEERKASAQSEEEEEEKEEEERKASAQSEEEEEEERKASAQSEEEEEEKEEEERKASAQSEEEEEEKEERKASAQSEEEEEEKEEEERKASAQSEEEEEEVTDAAEDDEGHRNKDEGDEEEDAGRMKMAVAAASCVPGILYLGHIPPRLRPKHLRNLLSVYGEIGRIFLQPEDHQVRARKRRSGLRRCDFTEGWVEFRDKRVAKRVAASLHNTPMATRKRQRFCSDLWCIKYLHRFMWTHLSERLAYEQTVLQQRLRTEVSQAKKETNFYLSNVERSAHLDKQRKRKQRGSQQVEDRSWDFTQRQTEEEIQMKKKRKKKDSLSQKHLDKARLIQEKSQSNVSLLAKIFNSNQSA